MTRRIAQREGVLTCPVRARAVGERTKASVHVGPTHDDAEAAASADADDDNAREHTANVAELEATSIAATYQAVLAAFTPARRRGLILTRGCQHYGARINLSRAKAAAVCC
jgi:hypothetical protein